jgi:hypothetical protein
MVSNPQPSLYSPAFACDEAFSVATLHGNAGKRMCMREACYRITHGRPSTPAKPTMNSAATLMTPRMTGFQSQQQHVSIQHTLECTSLLQNGHVQMSFCMYISIPFAVQQLRAPFRCSTFNVTAEFTVSIGERRAAGRLQSCDRIDQHHHELCRYTDDVTH